MTKLDQAFITHCTFHTSLYHQEPLDRGGDRTYEYTTRAGSFDRSLGLSFYQKFRAVAYYRNYRPEGASDDQLRELTHRDFPVRFAFLPDLGSNDLLIHACYRGFDTSKSRRAQCFFVHLLFHDRSKPGTAPILTARDVLPLWDSAAWTREDHSDLSHQLPQLTDLSEFAASSTAEFETTLQSFVTATSADRLLDPLGMVPQRWKEQPLEIRQNLLRAVLRSYFGVALQNRVCLVVAAEPGFAALLFFAIARLLPRRGFGSSQKGYQHQLSFSTFELTTDNFFPAKLVATTSPTPEKTEFSNKTGGPVIDCFKNIESLRPAGKKTLFEETLFLKILHRPNNWLSALDEDLVHIENAGPCSPDELDRAIRCVKTIQLLIRPRDGMPKSEVMLPETKEDRAFVAAAVAPVVSQLFGGDDLLVILQQPELFRTYLTCLEESNEPLTVEAAGNLGRVLGQKQVAQLCARKQLREKTRLEILASSLVVNDGSISEILKTFPLDAPLIEKGKPLAQELLSRLPFENLPQFFIAIHKDSAKRNTFVTLAKCLVGSERVNAEKERALITLVSLWVSSRASNKRYSPEVQLEELLFECIDEVPSDAKLKSITGRSAGIESTKVLGPVIGGVCQLLVSASLQNSEFQGLLTASLENVVNAADPKIIDKFVDRLSIGRELLPAVASPESMEERLATYGTHLASLKNAADTLNLHRQEKVSTFGKGEHQKKVESLERRVFEAAKKIIVFVNTKESDEDDSYRDSWMSSGEYELESKDLPTISNLVKLYNTYVDAKQLHSYFTGLPGRRSGRVSAKSKVSQSGSSNSWLMLLLGMTLGAAAIAGGTLYFIGFEGLIASSDGPPEPGAVEAAAAPATTTTRAGDNDPSKQIESQKVVPPTAPNNVAQPPGEAVGNSSPKVEPSSNNAAAPPKDDNKQAPSEEPPQLPELIPVHNLGAIVSDTKVPVFRVSEHEGAFRLPANYSGRPTAGNIAKEKEQWVFHPPTQVFDRPIAVFGPDDQTRPCFVIVGAAIEKWPTCALVERTDTHALVQAFFPEAMTPFNTAISVNLKNNSIIPIVKVDDNSLQPTHTEWRAIESHWRPVKETTDNPGSFEDLVSPLVPIISKPGIKLTRFELLQFLHEAAENSASEKATAKLKQKEYNINYKHVLDVLFALCQPESSEKPPKGNDLKNPCILRIKELATSGSTLTKILTDSDKGDVAMGATAPAIPQMEDGTPQSAVTTPVPGTPVDPNEAVRRNVRADIMLARRYVLTRAILHRYFSLLDDRQHAKRPIEPAEVMKEAFAAIEKQVKEQNEKNDFSSLLKAEDPENTTGAELLEKLRTEAVSWTVVTGLLLRTEEPPEVRGMTWEVVAGTDRVSVTISQTQ